MTKTRSWVAPALSMVMIAALVAIAILDIAPTIGIPGDLGTIVTLLAGLIFIVAHGTTALGWRGFVVFALATIVVSFTSEAIGVATGLVFGPYHYTDLLGPKLIGVPPMIQIGYLAMGYASMITGRIILSLIRKPARGWSVLAAALTGAFIMVSWDVAMDPYQSTVVGDWLWHTGGPYFGVPLHNYAGWFGTVFIFMLLYFMYANRFGEQTRNDLISNQTAFWSLPVVYYALTAIGIIIIPIIGGVSLPYASPANYSGTLQQLEGSMTLVATFVMGTPTIFALCRLRSAVESTA